MQYKQAILIRMDLKLPKGKMASQAAHAAVDSVMKSRPERVDKWKRQGMKKVVLKVKDLAELSQYDQKAKDAGLVSVIIRDAGKTEVEPGTITCMAIGPDEDMRIDRITGKLPLL
jgi:PTH2 family peptidyl-tRNA hydrolase